MRNRIVLAHDLPMPMEEVGKMLQAVSDTGDWYLARDPSRQIEELLVEHGGTIKIRRRPPGRPPYSVSLDDIIGEGDTVEDALLDVYYKAKAQGVIDGP